MGNTIFLVDCVTVCDSATKLVEALHPVVKEIDKMAIRNICWDFEHAAFILTRYWPLQ